MDETEFRPFRILRIIGYILLGLSVIDYLAILLPPRGLDPAWEFEAMSRLVEQIWGPLLGLGLVFLYPENDLVSRKRLRLLTFLSWVSLLLGILYFLMLPLGINNSIKLYDRINASINAQVVQQKQQLARLNQKVNASTSPDELVALSQRISPDLDAPDTSNLIELKKQLSQQIQEADAKISASSSEEASQRSTNLIKAAVKFCLGAILSGTSLITIFNVTSWVRFLNKVENS